MSASPPPPRRPAGSRVRVLLVLVVVGVVLATRTPQEATAVAEPAARAHGARRSPAPTCARARRCRWPRCAGHYVVVNFFASWCVPCQQEAPDLSRFHYEQTHAADGADMVSVVFHDTSSHGPRASCRQNGDLWPAVSDPRRHHRPALRGDGAADDLPHRSRPAASPRSLVGPATQKNLDSFLGGPHGSRPRVPTDG